MPSTTTGSYSTTYRLPSSVPTTVIDALEGQAENANVILPAYYKALEQEGKLQLDRSSRSGICWITVSTYGQTPSLDLVLSVTETEIGKYPIFITPLASSPNVRSEELLRPLIEILIDALLKAVPVKRVYSVFAPDDIAVLFTEMWSEKNDIAYYPEPYYAAKLTFCTKSTLVARQATIHPDVHYDLRPAQERDIDAVADLCYGFAKDSEPFVMTREHAHAEARMLLRNGQVWVHSVRIQGEIHEEIASLVAFTRNSSTVSTITKVYTNPRWRRRGCAERLVREVCKFLLKTKKAVVLYVAHGNPAAAHVYHRVGFAGLSPGSPAVKGVESWSEYGFDRTEVDLGHW